VPVAVLEADAQQTSTVSAALPRQQKPATQPPAATPKTAEPIRPITVLLNLLLLLGLIVTCTFPKKVMLSGQLEQLLDNGAGSARKLPAAGDL